jgi:hypothetical protein
MSDDGPQCESKCRTHPFKHVKERHGVLGLEGRTAPSCGRLILAPVPNPHTSLWPLWVLGSVLCLGGLYVAGANWAAIFLSLRNKRRGVNKRYSQGPVIGPLLGYFGLQALPLRKSPWIWLVLLIDPSTWIVVVSIPFLIREVRRSATAATERGEPIPRLFRWAESFARKRRARSKGQAP